MDSVYKRAIRKKEEQENKGSEVELKPEEEVAKDNRPILAQVNDKLRAEIKTINGEAKEWRERYYGLKAGYELLESKYETLKNNLKMMLEGDVELKAIDDGSRNRKKAHPTPKELRKAELL